MMKGHRDTDTKNSITKTKDLNIWIVKITSRWRDKQYVMWGPGEQKGG